MLFKHFVPVIFLVAISTFVLAEAQDELEYKPGEIIVRFNKDKGKSKTIKEKQGLIDKTGGLALRMGACWAIVEKKLIFRYNFDGWGL